MTGSPKPSQPEHHTHDLLLIGDSVGRWAWDGSPDHARDAPAPQSLSRPCCGQHWSRCCCTQHQSNCRRVAESEGRLAALQADVQAKVSVMMTHLDGLARREARHAQRRGASPELLLSVLSSPDHWQDLSCWHATGPRQPGQYKLRLPVEGACRVWTRCD